MGTNVGVHLGAGGTNRVALNHTPCIFGMFKRGTKAGKQYIRNQTEASCMISEHDKNNSAGW